MRLFGTTSIARSVDGGQVLCPIRMSDVDVERCMSCGLLDRMDARDDGSPEGIVCKPPVRDLIMAAEAMYP